MAQPTATPLLGMTIYLDRTVYSRIFEKGKKMQLKEKIKIMGGTLVDDPNEATIILGHPGYTLLDYAYTDTRAMIVSYHYVEEHCGDRNAPSLFKYLTYIQPKGDAAFVPPIPVGPVAPKNPNVLVDSDPEAERDEVERAIAPALEPYLAEKEVLVGAQGHARALSQDPGGLAPRVRQVTAPTRADGGTALPAPPEAAPVPTFRVPDSSAFKHDEVREWACSFVRWSATYRPSRQDSTIIRNASVQMSKIAKQLRISSFRNYVVKEKEFSARVVQVIRHARTHAERNSIQEISEKEMTALVSAAGKAYRSQYGLGRPLTNPAKPPAAAPTPVPSTSKNAPATPAIPPPHLPTEMFYPRGQRQNLFTEAGHAYMRQAFRWQLLVDPTRKWLDMAIAVKAASNGQVSQRAFLEYRKCSAFANILEEYAADPAAFRTAYDELLREPRPVENDRAPNGEPVRKRRRIEQRAPNRMNDGAASRSAMRLPSPTYSELSPTATMDQDGSDYCD